MYIENIEITNFRNIEKINTSFNKKYNIFYGKNAQGKTNFLEALSLTLNGMSHREKNTSNFIKNGEDFSLISAKVIKEDDIDTFIKCVIKDKRKYEINSSPIKSRTELLREYNLVMFTPEDLKIIKGYPADRRKFLNESISHIFPSYHSALRKYNKALKQRNAILRDYSKRNIASSLLEVYDETLYTIGSDIIKIRINVLKKIGKITNELNKEVSKDEEVRFFYSSNVLENAKDLKDIKSLYKKALKNSRNDDLMKGSTTIGVHHDDINIFLNDLDTKKFASQGQQRSISLCMKLSLIKLLYDKFDDYPIVLLDDVMSDLDKFRQKQILNLIKDTQSFITCVNYSFLEDIDDYKIYKIEKGNLMGGK
ncbi:DNA replication/repair protein RecF [Anaerofustis stercorihominis]|uniref:DNA replication/repair protein RecF n=1 Tax=Anaerofustis stercorihominis TaxID=214853 RepID=UPI0039916231